MNDAALAARRLANRLRWQPGRRGCYEVWYLTGSDPASGVGFWLRHTLHAPTSPTEPVTATLWAACFDPAAPERNCGLRRTVAVESVSLEAEPLRWSWPVSAGAGDGVAGAEFSEGRARGHVQGHDQSAGRRIAWDLEFDEPPDPLWPLPAWAYRYPVSSSLLALPFPDARFRGRLEWDGRTFVLQGAPGCQSHVWGRKHARAWWWVRCGAFQDDARGAWVEAVGARLARGPVPLPGMLTVHVRLDGRAYRFDSLGQLLRGKFQAQENGWSFVTRPAHREHGGDLRVRGTVTWRVEDLLRADYLDPDGEPAYCHNTEVADLDLVLEARGEAGSWQEEARLRAAGTAHTEYGRRSPDPRVLRAYLTV